MHERASLVHKDECMERLTISSQYLARTAVNDLVHFRFHSKLLHVVHDYGFTDARARVSWGRKWSAASQFDDGSINDDNVPQSGRGGRSQTSVDATTS